MTKPSIFDADYDPIGRHPHISRHPVAFFVGIFVLVALIGAGVWAISVGTSDIAGRGNAVKLKNTAINRTQAQAAFHQEFTGIKALDQKLTDAQGALDTFVKAHPNIGANGGYDPLVEKENYLQTDLTGAQQQCRNASAQYDADTETYTLRDFRDSDLPFKISASDPVFVNGTASFADYDCQPGQ